MKEADLFYHSQNKEIKNCLLAMRDIILNQSPDVVASWKYGMPFFCYKGKMFCYLWVHKKLKCPYLGFVEGHLFNDVQLLSEKRSKMKIFLLDAHGDLPIEKINGWMKEAMAFYETRPNL